MRSWQVAYQSKDAKRSEMTYFSDYKQVPDNLRGVRIPKSMFPPEMTTEESKALRNCMRLFPTDQNTGGFFVTLLRKKHDLPGDLQIGLKSYEDEAREAKKAEKKKALQTAELGQEASSQQQKTHRWPISEKAQRRIEAAALKMKAELAGETKNDERVHQYAKLSAEHWTHIQDFYGIKDGFPHVSAADGRCLL